MKSLQQLILNIGLASVTGITGVLFSHAANAANVGGLDFADNAFADSLLLSSGSFNPFPGSLEDALTDKDATSFALSFSPGAVVQLGFTDNVAVNGQGADIALFELGLPDTFKIGINGVNKSVLSVDTGTMMGGFALNVAKIDLSDFGLAPDSVIDNLFVGLDTVSANDTVPALSLVGALNSASATAIPTPALLPGLIGMGIAALRKRRALSEEVENN